MSESTIIESILKDKQFRLSQFSQAAIDELEAAIFIKETKKSSAPYVKCLQREKDVKLTPEEIVRQLYLKQLLEDYQYPKSRISVEHGVSFGSEKKRADIVVFDKDRPTVPYIIVELKKPKLKEGKDQLKSYCNATGAPMGIWTNGDSISYYHRKDPNYFEDITDIPNVNQTLADILNERFTWNDLVKRDKLRNERKSLRAVIEEMEDEVLANAGVDVFEEVFKLVFAKLYDEWLSGCDDYNKANRLLEFRNTGQTETELKAKIQALFDKAKDKWFGVFDEESKITLSPSHLSVCVASLENVKLFNSNLDVVDEAFEYLINKSSKGEKGQYFTPRYVIDMCVKMLNPQEGESLIDTAAGSSGFTVHGIFHVWRQIFLDMGLASSDLFTVEKKPQRCTDYVNDKVFAIDFDEKAVRVARTLNLIAGDGQTNVLHLNTLDYERWDEWLKDDGWRDTYNDGFKKLKKLCVGKGKQGFKSFGFDVLLANPPFAGDIKETRIVHKYGLAEKPNGKRHTKLGRDVLFIERNLDFLKPGGRMAVVLPQGRFNNSSDKAIRDFIAERCRILAVVGLHGNTFKPHTGTKTSVLFVQKWNDDASVGALCPKVEDYPIFFATMQESGKDNSGDKIYVKQDDGEGLLDNHGHLIVQHDLFNHDGLTQDGIAEAFIEFAKKENLSFFELGSSVAPFDADKYQRLMDELEATVILYSSVKKSSYLRLEAEFYLFNQKYSKEFFTGNDIIDFVQYGTSKELNECNLGYPTLRLNEFENGFIKMPEKYCNLIDYDTFQNLRLIKGDVLICRTNGNPKLVGKSAIVLEDTEYSYASYLYKIRPKKEFILPEVLCIYLNSTIGKHEVEKYSITSNQTNFSPAKFREILIPKLSFSFQEKVKYFVHNSYSLRNTSLSLYKKAETRLLEALGLKDWQVPENNTSIKTFSASFGTSGRLDAEFYQPRFESLLSKIQQKHKLTRLGDLLTINQRGKQPKYVEQNGLPVINSKHVRTGQVLLDSDNRIASYDTANKLIIKKGDVLINGTGVGTIGRASAYLHEQNALPDNHVTILRTDKLNPIYLATCINSILGQFQVEKYQKGSSGQIELYPNDIDEFLIWNAPQEIQKTIDEKVNASYHAREQSQQLLHIAKTAVEKAIETDEQTAINWLKAEQLKIEGKL